jgi:hypothetical protein
LWQVQEFENIKYHRRSGDQRFGKKGKFEVELHWRRVVVVVRWRVFELAGEAKAVTCFTVCSSALTITVAKLQK